MEIPWFAWIAFAGIAVWGTTVIIGAVRGTSKDEGLQKALEDNAATNRALLAKLETIDTRLGVVEKTLTDIQ